MALKRRVILSTLVLATLGMIMIYSASSYSAELHTGDAFFYVKKQALGFIAGLVTMLLGYKVKVEWLSKFKWAIYAVSMVLLLILFIPGVGQSSYGATRWINLGFITLQSSEIAKFGLVIFLACYLADHPPTTIKKLIIPVICGMAMCVAVMLEPNMSITIVIGASLMVMLYLGGMQRKHIVVGIVLVAIALPLLILLEPYRIKRLVAFVDPWANPKGEGYQLIQSYYALGSGGVFGVGLFNSRQKYLYLPFAESDFIFSVIGEELGLVGCVCVLTVFLVLIVSGVKIAIKADGNKERLLAAGITTVIAIQTLLNVAVVSGSVPPTGVPLPYVSAGGSSLMVFMFASGILCKLAPQDNKAQIKPFHKKINRKIKIHA